REQLFLDDVLVISVSLGHRLGDPQLSGGRLFRFRVLFLRVVVGTRYSRDKQRCEQGRRGRDHSRSHNIVSVVRMGEASRRSQLPCALRNASLAALSFCWAAISSTLAWFTLISAWSISSLAAPCFAASSSTWACLTLVSASVTADSASATCAWASSR